MINTLKLLNNKGLIYEFVETLMNETDLSLLLRRQIWFLASTNNINEEEICGKIVDSFVESESSADLNTQWLEIVEQYWPGMPSCSLKKEIEQDATREED